MPPCWWHHALWLGAGVCVCSVASIHRVPLIELGPFLISIFRHTKSKWGIITINNHTKWVRSEWTDGLVFWFILIFFDSIRECSWWTKGTMHNIRCIYIYTETWTYFPATVGSFTIVIHFESQSRIRQSFKAHMQNSYSNEWSEFVSVSKWN